MDGHAPLHLPGSDRRWTRGSGDQSNSAAFVNDRYMLNGRPQQVMLSARELNSNSLPNRTWVNERLTFTHGYGLTLGPVNQVTSEGLPVLFVRNLPTETTPDLPLQEPSLYFGELSNDYVIVRTRYRRGDASLSAAHVDDGLVALPWKRGGDCLRDTED